MNNPVHENSLTFLEQEMALESKKSKKQLIPLTILLCAGILIFIYSLLFWQSSVVIRINSTRFIIHGVSFMSWLSIFIFLEWLCYWFWRRFLYSQLLTWLHVIITCVICISFVATHRSYFKFHNMDMIQSTLIQTLLNSEMRVIEFSNLTSYFFVAAQLLFLFNWGFGFLKQKREKQISTTGKLS